MIRLTSFIDTHKTDFKSVKTGDDSKFDKDGKKDEDVSNEKGKFLDVIIALSAYARVYVPSG